MLRFPGERASCLLVPLLSKSTGGLSSHHSQLSSGFTSSWKPCLPLTSGVSQVTLQKPASHRQSATLGASGSVSCRGPEDQDWVFAA